MTNDDLGMRSAVELAAAVRGGQVSSRELVDHYLGRIDRLNPAVNAVVTVDADRAQAEARALDEALARGELRGPLHGVPITIKDSFDTAGMRTTVGAVELADRVPDEDAVAVARVRAAGAVVLGKTNLPAWAGDCQAYNDVFGTTNNPWALDRATGGSSGGSAAAVAAGLTALDLGSDIGGSIRAPAHFCGVYGLKPTWGVASTRGHIPPPPGVLSELDTAVVGPLARSADDLDAALAVLAGPDEARAVAWRLELPAPRAGRLADYRIAVHLDDAYCPVDGEMRQVLAAAVDALRAAGARVDDDPPTLPSLAEGHDIAQRLIQGSVSHGVPPEEFDRLLADAAARAADDDSPPARWARNITQRVRDFNVAVEQRVQLAARWRAFFLDYDVVLTPVTISPAFPHDHSPDVDARTVLVDGRPRPYGDQFAWMQAVGVVHLPVVVAPVGRTRAGLPVGMQMVGPYLEDRTPIDVARRTAEVVGGFVPPPGF